MPRRPAPPDVIERWKPFLRNHRGEIAACDCITVPTVTFDVLYVFFVNHHARRQILHVNVTGHPIGKAFVVALDVAVEGAVASPSGAPVSTAVFPSRVGEPWMSIEERQ